MVHAFEYYIANLDDNRISDLLSVYDTNNVHIECTDHINIGGSIILHDTTIYQYYIILLYLSYCLYK